MDVKVASKGYKHQNKRRIAKHSRTYSDRYYVMELLLFMDVSILIPIYNVEDYLAKCLRSIPHNDLKMELICINDGSTDESISVLKKAAQDDKRIIVINKQNEGYGAALNQGIQQAKGRYIGIIEPDDYLDGDMFSALFSYAQALDFPDIVKSAYWSVDETDDSNRKLCGFYGRIQVSQHVFRIEDEPLLLRYHPSIWSAIYKKEFLDAQDIHFKQVPGAGWVDNPFLIETLCQAETIAYTDKAFYCYRENRTGSSTDIIADFHIPLDRWIESTKALKRIGVDNKRIWDIHAYRCIYNLNVARHARNYSENKAEWLIYAKQMVKQLHPSNFIRAIRYLK